MAIHIISASVQIWITLLQSLNWPIFQKLVSRCASYTIQMPKWVTRVRIMWYVSSEEKERQTRWVIYFFFFNLFDDDWEYAVPCISKRGIYQSQSAVRWNDFKILIKFNYKPMNLPQAIRLMMHLKPWFQLQP